MIAETITRQQVVDEAVSWIGTPYIKNGRVKGVGADCATLLFCVYMNCGLVPREDEGIFSDPEIVPIGQDWWCNLNEDKYLLRMMRYAHKVAQAVGYPSLEVKPGNLVLTKCRNSRHFNHGAIALKWPKIIHADAENGIELASAFTHCLWSYQEVAIFDPWEKR